MIDLAFDSALETLLNQFSVPMFALDRAGPQDAFRFVCINDALEQGGDWPAENVLGRSVYELLPKVEADIAHTRYTQCIDQGGALRYSDRFTTAGRPVVWDTTLQHVALKDGGDRVVGTCIKIAEDLPEAHQEPALDDIQYFSSMADLQLQNLISTFEIFRDRELFAIQNEQHIDKLAGMCRTVQRAVEDIKKVVRTSHNSPSRPELMKRDSAKPVVARVKCPAGSDTVEALFADVAGDLQRLG
jgi:hypothetical protein